MCAQRWYKFRAGAVPGPQALAHSQADLCPADLAGFCREGLRCRKGLHGFCLVSEVEQQLAERPVTSSHECNFLRSAPRQVGMGDIDERYHLDAPGMNSPQGPRHDNDFVSIQSVQILPSTDEILSLRVPHLPIKDNALQLAWGTPEDTFRQYCAVQFRHLRFECIEPVIDAVYLAFQMLVLSRHRPPPTDYTYHRDTTKGVGFNYFVGVGLKELSFHQYDGIQIGLSFNCPAALRGDGMRLSNALENGKLCCLIGVNTETEELYSVFLETVERHSTWGTASKTPEQPSAGIIAKLADPADVSKARELVWLAKSAPSCLRFGLVDMTGVLFTSFSHHLGLLRALNRETSEPPPFITSLLHPGSSDTVRELAPPEYSKVEGFEWKLNGLKCDNSDDQPFVLSNGAKKDNALVELRSRTTLDVGQAEALFDNLTRQLAFTQGPPGTGKSFLGISTIKVFVDSIPVEKRGPVVVVAQTNHALDEILEGLLDKDIEQVVRLGSRSKSTRLEKTFLKHQRRKKVESCQETSRRKDAEMTTRQLERDGGTFCEVISNATVAGLVTQLEELSVKPKNPNKSDSSSGSGSSPHEDTSGDETAADPNSVSAKRRSRKKDVRHFVKSLSRSCQCDLLVEVHRRHQQAREKFHDASRLKNLNLLKQRDVVGMTTSACAREVELLRQLKPQILVVEEASEVLEAHTICALIPTIQHCINIGDPLQLRPHIATRVLETEYNPHYRLNEPLFERLINEGLPYAKLSVQRRAHPELSSLIQATDYPFVVNHESTLERPPVRGMASRLQWCHHSYPERLVTPREGLITESWANDFEVDMAVHFASKFIKDHGYGPGDVAILTPYNGQLALLTKKLASEGIMVDVSKEDREALITGGYMSRADLGPVMNKPELQVNISELLRVATVDNFQGEEARIVILCTVRSNDRGKIGFMKISNRINVAVSRAREGFFVIGNANVFRQNSAHWAKIINQFEKQRGLESGFRVTCRYHPEETILLGDVRQAEMASDWLTYICDKCWGFGKVDNNAAAIAVAC